MPMVRAMRLLNAIEAGTLIGAQLEALLAADPGRLAEFNALVGMRGQLLRMRSSETARTALVSSASAAAGVTSNDVALRQWLLAGTNYNWRSFANLNALLNSAPAMAEVAASQSAMALLITSAPAMAAVADSSTAMTAIAASALAMTAVIASSTAMTAVAASSTAMTAVAESATAMGLVAASTTAMATVSGSTAAMAAIAASSTAMTAVTASTSAMNAMFANATAKTALYDSTLASDAIFASASAKAYLVSIAQNSQNLATTGVAANIGKTYFLQQRAGGGINALAGNSSSSSTYQTASTAYVDRFVKLTSLYHRTSNVASASFVTFVDMD